MDRKCIFLDIDGTLTPAGSNRPPRSALAAVRAAQAKGHMVFLCTGRNPDMLAPVLAYGFDGAVACAGGRVFAQDRVLYDHPMPATDRDTALRLLKQGGVFRTIEALDATYGDEDLGDFLTRAGEGNSELVRWRRALAEQLNIRPMAEYDGRPIYKVVFMCTDAGQLEPARAALERDYHFVIQDDASHHCLNGEIINRAFDKGKGVRIIAEAFGFELADTLGFGDSMNDLEMIQTVGTSVCMDNGSPTLKELSTFVCPAVEADGLAWAFEKLGLI
ncbi:MAG: HAD hydrolase family protein [Clostridia bacterium]|nr:HAD hydrolase family protein [Clostridia bacterium]